MKKKNIIKGFFVFVMMLGVAISAFAMLACAGRGQVDPRDHNIHEVFFLGNGGRVGGGFYQTHLLQRNRLGGGRLAYSHIDNPLRRGYSFLGWYQVNAGEDDIGITTVRRYNADNYPIYEQFMYVVGHNYAGFPDLFRSLTTIDLESEMRFERDAEGDIVARIDQGEYLTRFTTGEQWNFELDELDISSYTGRDANGNEIWNNQRSVFVAMWQSQRRFVILPTHTQWHRDLNPDDPDYDDMIARLPEGSMGRERLVRTIVRRDGSVSRASLWMAYYREGFQIVGFYQDPQHRQPIPWTPAGHWLPRMEFLRDAQGYETDTMTTIRIFPRYIDRSYEIIRSPDDLAVGDDFAFSDSPYYFATPELDLGGRALDFPPTFNRRITGNGVRIHNFVRNVRMRVISNLEEWNATASNPAYGGLFNHLGPSANIRDITFDNFIINFIHINTISNNFLMGDYLASYHPFRPPIINVFAASASPASRARNIRLNFTHREELYVGSGLAGWRGNEVAVDANGEIIRQPLMIPIRQYILDIDGNRIWSWELGDYLHDIIGYEHARATVRDYEKILDIDGYPVLDGEGNYTFRVVFVPAYDIDGNPIYQYHPIRLGGLAAFRQLQTPDYAQALTFRQVGANFGGYFGSVPIAGLYGAHLNLNVYHMYAGEARPPISPNHIGLRLTDDMDFDVFFDDFYGQFPGMTFVGWFIFDEEGAEVEFVRFNIRDFEVSEGVFVFPDRLLNANNGEGAFIIPAWQG